QRVRARGHGQRDAAHAVGRRQAERTDRPDARSGHPAAAGAEAHGRPRAAARAVRALLISIAAVLVSAPAALAQTPVDDAIEALKDDTVYLDPDGPQGFTPQIADAYRQQIDAAGGNIFLAILPSGAAGSAEDAIGEL